MKKLAIVLLLSAIAKTSFCQAIDKIINSKEVERIEQTLSSNDMQGRKVGTAGIDKAGDFICNEFKEAGLKTFDCLKGYKQSFMMIKPKLITVTAQLEQEPVDSKAIVIFSSQPDLKINQQSDFEKVAIRAGTNFNIEARKYITANKNYVVLVDPSFSQNFSRLSYMNRQIFKSDRSVVFILTALKPQEYQVTAKYEFTEQPMANVVGVLPGKSLKNECVVFSAHYDHLGFGKVVNGDSIYNGANDDAAGTTAVIMLAKYFKALNNNERTLIFTAFTAEEIGGFGSQYFSNQLQPEKVIAMFNIEMIGTESKWGRGSAYITGYDMSNMGEILEKNLAGSAFKFYPDPYIEQQLFYRSDNATLARLGVPAHTISTSKMDNEPNYHKVSDEIGTLDMNNMAEIIKAIAISSTSIIAGKDAPSRVNISALKL